MPVIQTCHDESHVSASTEPFYQTAAAAKPREKSKKRQ